MHPDPKYLIELYKEEAILHPEAKKSLYSEMEMQLGYEDMERLSSESCLASAIVVASSFTKKTLVDSGINQDKITVIPYGVDCELFPIKKNKTDTSKPLRIIFIGALIQRKGLSYLLDAVAQFNSTEIELVLLTRDYIDQPLLDRYSKSNIKILIGLEHKEMVGQLHKSDIFILPSLAEGFGQVIVEAMSCGLPAIVSENTAGVDFIEHDVDGWIVNIRATDQIVNIIQYAIDNRIKIQEMGLLASEKAQAMNWKKFRKEIVNFYIIHSQF